MPDSRPRDLTSAELELVKAPAYGGGTQTAPLAIPPGMAVPVSELNPAAGRTAESGAPTAEPPAASTTTGGPS